MELDQLIWQTKQQAHKLTSLHTANKNQLLQDLALALEANQRYLLKANQQDLEIAQASNLASSLQDRLTLNEERLASMAQGLMKIAEIPDPLTENQTWQLENGLVICKQTVPLGLLLIIYEARPNVTTDAFALALKTGNACFLKGSRQTRHTNEALASLIKPLLQKHDLDQVFHFLTNISTEESIDLIAHPAFDLIIPRGGENLKNLVQSKAQSPVLGAGGGICHAYISEYADLEKAAQIIFNAKTQRPSVCNALEKVLINHKLLQPEIIDTIFKPCIEAGVLLKADAPLQKLNSVFVQATSQDWKTEYLDLILTVKSVNSVEEAAAHINEYGTGHSEVIISEDEAEASLFGQLVDAACVYTNASTRFTDGEVFGFGAEIGISTQKLHARGPLGAKELTTYKYLIKGDGQTR